ncbi:hypothetical protein KDV94_01090 [Providencia rettgeri]
MKIVNLSQREEDWLDWRRQGVTATDAAILSYLINPLSRAVFDQDLQPNSAYQIVEIATGETTQITLAAMSN